MRLLKPILGEFHWHPPAWLQSIGPARFGSLLLLGFVGIGAWLSWRHYQESRPQPPQVTATLEAPAVTPIVDGIPQPQPLLVKFAVEVDPRAPVDVSQSVARLDQLDSDALGGVELKPQIEGSWRWRDESTLQFSPAEDWPAGETYQITWQQNLFRADLEFAALSASFTTPALSVTVPRWEFYQHPEDPSERRVVGTLEFSHAVDVKELDSYLQLGMRQSGETLEQSAAAVGYTLQSEQADRRVYVRSAVIDLPDQENYMSLVLAAGIPAASGPSTTAEQVIQHATIPDIGSYFRVANARTLVVKNEDDRAVQNLTLALTDRVTTQRLAERLKVYLLPTSIAINGSTRRGVTWQSPREITAAVLAQATLIPVELNAVADGIAAQHSATLDLPAGRQIYVQIDAGLTSAGEYVLSQSYDTVLRVPQYPREASIAQQGALLPLSGEQTLTLIGRGVSTLRVEVARLLPDAVNHLATQTGGDIESPYFTNYNISQDNLTERQIRFVDLESAHPAEPVYASLDLGQFARGSGAYFVTVQGWDRGRQRAVGASDKRFVLTTDLGLIVKTNNDQSHDVFVHQLTGVGPAVGARVALLGKNGQPVFTAITNASGRAQIPSTRELERERYPSVFVVTLGDDTVFLPFNRYERQLQYSRFDVGGDYAQAQTSRQLRAQLFSDRGLYRPGETLRLAAIVKRSDWGTVPRVPVRLQISGPSGATLTDRQLTLPADGFIEAAVATEVSTPTGYYDARLVLVENNNRRRVLGTTSLRIEEFQPDRLRIRTQISGQQPLGWLAPDDLSAQVTLSNLFGAPAQDRDVRGEIVITPATLQVAALNDYTFVDPLRDPDSPLTEQRVELAGATTNDEGQASLPLDLSRYGRGLYQLQVLTQGFEQSGGRAVRSRASVMISPMEMLVGFKANTDLHFIDRDSAHNIDFVAIDRRTTQVPADDLTRVLIARNHVSSLVQRPDGTYAYESVEQRTEINRAPFSIEAAGSSLQLPTDSAGEFEISVEDAQGRVLSRVPYRVVGTQNLAGNLERNAELDIQLREASVAAGGELEIAVTAPYAGVGLITIEREQTYTHRWFKTKSNTSVQSIQVPGNLEGNAYVNVAFIRDLDSPEIFISPLSYAVAPFSIDRDARTIEVSVTAPERVRPGESFRVDYATSRDARIVVYAVDTGILQVADYETPDPLGFFLRKLALNVRTLQMVDLILPGYSAWRSRAAPGGGEAASLLGRNLNPFRREAEAPMVYWSGIIDSGPVGGRLEIDVPDYFAGELSVMAVAVNDAAVGHAKTTTRAKGPFVLTPNMLTAATPADEFDVVVGIANQREPGSASRVSVTADAGANLTVLGEATQTITLAPGNEDKVTFRIRAGTSFGESAITFRAQAGSEQQTRRATLSVRPLQTFLTTVSAQSSRADPTAVVFDRALAAELAEQHVAASVNPIVLTDGLLAYLETFPHACTEQLVSTTFPTLGFIGFDDAAYDDIKIRDGFDETIDRLRSRQRSDGGFRFWASSRETATFPTIYLTHFLTDAKALAIPVPDAMLRASLGYLERYASEPSADLVHARLRAYAIYVLTRNGVITTNALTQLHESLDRDMPDRWRQDISASWMAASYQLLQQADLANQLITEYRWMVSDEDSTDFDSQLTHDAQHLYLLARHFADRLERAGSERVEAIAEGVMQNRFNTVSAAFASLALSEVGRANEATAPARQLRLLVDGAVIAESNRTVRGAVDVGNRDISIIGAEQQPIYFVATQSGYDLEGSAEPVAQGLEITRDYLDSNGRVISQGRVGDTVTIRVRVRAPNRSRSNIAIVDLLPGGFEIDAARAREIGGADHLDIREDRVVIYTAVPTQVREFTYEARLVSTGKFSVPAASAKSMYDLSLRASTASGEFEITP